MTKQEIIKKIKKAKTAREQVKLIFLLQKCREDEAIAKEIKSIPKTLIY
jgi:hypothetical protein